MTRHAAQIGMVACNDYILLESCIYRMLQLNLADHPSYAKLLELFHEVTTSILSLTASSPISRSCPRLPTTPIKQTLSWLS